MSVEWISVASGVEIPPNDDVVRPTSCSLFHSFCCRYCSDKIRKNKVPRYRTTTRRATSSRHRNVGSLARRSRYQPRNIRIQRSVRSRTLLMFPHSINSFLPVRRHHRRQNQLSAAFQNDATKTTVGSVNSTVAMVAVIACDRRLRWVGTGPPTTPSGGTSISNFFNQITIIQTSSSLEDCQPTCIDRKLIWLTNPTASGGPL